MRRFPCIGVLIRALAYQHIYLCANVLYGNPFMLLGFSMIPLVPLLHVVHQHFVKDAQLQVSLSVI